jgi:hypothetical protein
MKTTILAVCCSAVVASAQGTFVRTYGGDSADYGYQVLQAHDGGYVLIGATSSSGAGDCDFWLIKTDSLGDTLWTRTYGGTGYDAGIAVAQTTDGGYTVAGETWSFGAGAGDFWLIKTDSLGDTLWTRTYGGTGYDGAGAVAQTSDGGYVATGLTRSFGAGGFDVWLVRTDALGDTLWTRIYGDTGIDIGRWVAQTPDSGFVVAGVTESYGSGGRDVWLIKTDPSGDTLWTRTYGGTHDDHGYSVTQTVDSGYAAVGFTVSYGAGGYDVWLIKTDPSGDTLWTRTYGGTSLDYGYSVAQTMDGGYIIGGETMSFGAGYQDAWLVKTDASGDTKWTRTFGGTGNDKCYAVAQTDDGGYIMGGQTQSFGLVEADAWLIKTDSAGLLAVEEPETPGTRRAAAATIVSGTLRYQPTANSSRQSAVLLDLTGRKVLDLQPGQNDISRLSPGVYFLKSEVPNRSAELAVRKVVIQH